MNSTPVFVWFTLFFVTGAFEIGNVARMKDYPWVVAIYYKLEKVRQPPICTGSIITKEWVLTTCYCMRLRAHDTEQPLYQTPKDLFVVAGSNFMAEPGKLDYFTVVNVESVVFPTDSEAYTHFLNLYKFVRYPQLGPNIYNTTEGSSQPAIELCWLDFALLQLSEYLKFNDKIFTLPFPSFNWKKTESLMADFFKGWPQYCKVAGWGHHNWGKMSERSIRLTETWAAPVERDACVTRFCKEDPGFFSRHHVSEWKHFCAKSLYPGDACFQDRGAPLYCPKFYGGAVLGILSVPPTCFGSNQASVYIGIQTSYQMIQRVLRRPWPPPHETLNLKFPQSYEGEALSPPQ